MEEVDWQDDGIEKEQARASLQRMQTNRTGTTASSIATSDGGEQEETPPRKRTWGEKLNPLKHKTIPPVPKERKPSREHGAGFFSLLTFQWIAPLMSVGYQRPLEVNDVWWVNPDRTVDTLSEKLLASLHRRNENASKRPLTMALFDTFKKEFCIGGACALTSALCQILSPFTMKYLIRFAGEAYLAAVTGIPAPHIANGIGLVIGITCMQVVQSLCTNHFIYRGMMVGGQVRAVLIAVIFDKATKISGRARAGGKAKDVNDNHQVPSNVQPGSEDEKSFFKRKLAKLKPKAKVPAVNDGQGWSNGRIVNLMSTDTYRIDQASVSVNPDELAQTNIEHLLICR